MKELENISHEKLVENFEKVIVGITIPYDKLSLELEMLKRFKKAILELKENRALIDKFILASSDNASIYLESKGYIKSDIDKITNKIIKTLNLNTD